MLNIIYAHLIKEYGPQGWWPIVDEKQAVACYHVSAPRHDNDIFEISVGAVLTQNVAWNNVIPALVNLKKNGLLSPPALYGSHPDTIAVLIKSSGYFNQKAKRIRELSRWFIDNRQIISRLGEWDVMPLRENLLAITGVGQETADSILLYAFTKKIFVIDAYTRRLFTRLGMLQGPEDYREIQELFHGGFSGDLDGYREYHALIVAHAKDYCRKNPLCGQCSLRPFCKGVA